MGNGKSASNMLNRIRNWVERKRTKSNTESANNVRTLNYQAHIREQTQNGEVIHTLSFSSYQKVPRQIGEDMSGCQYEIHGRVYTDVISLKKRELEQISKNVSVYSDCYGNTVLAFYTDIPTFDSGDREWDSLHAEYLLYDGKEYALISCKSGYRIAEIAVYSGLVSVSEGMRPWFNRLGFEISQ